MYEGWLTRRSADKPGGTLLHVLTVCSESHSGLQDPKLNISSELPAQLDPTFTLALRICSMGSWTLCTKCCTLLDWSFKASLAEQSLSNELLALGLTFTLALRITREKPVYAQWICSEPAAQRAVPCWTDPSKQVWQKSWGSRTFLWSAQKRYHDRISMKVCSCSGNHSGRDGETLSHHVSFLPPWRTKKGGRETYRRDRIRVT